MIEHSALASFPQQRLWFLDQLEPGTSAYNLPRLIKVEGRLDSAALGEAVHTVVVRHEALRTGFAMRDGKPWQIIYGAVRVELPVVDLQELPVEQRETEAMRLARLEAHRGFELDAPPLLRVKLFRLSREQHVLLLVMHHIVTDGWSMSILFREMADAYRARTTGQATVWPPLGLQYSDFAQWQRDYLASDLYERDLTFWRENLAGARGLIDLPTDRPRPPVQNHRGATEFLQIPESVAGELKRLAQREGGTLFMTLLTAFQVLLWRYCQSEDLLIGTPVAARHDVKLEDLVGFFVNTIILRGDLSGNPTVRELLRRTREMALASFTHQNLPFEKLVEVLQPERALSHTPLFQVMFVLQNTPKQVLELPSLTLEELEFDSGLSKFDLTLEVIEQDGLRCGFEYDTDLFDRPTVQQMARHFANLLQGFLRGPGQRIADLDMLDRAERDTLLVGLNATAADYPRDLRIDQAFEAQARLTPDAVALLEGGTSVSYRDLERRADKIAAALRYRGVDQSTPVGVYLHRSIDAVASLLGVLKAGAPYVPLDPTNPRQRVELLIGDSRCRVVVTQQSLAGDLPKTIDAFAVDAPWSAEIAPAALLPVTPSSEALAYIIYTSGSTGVPKGVEGSHRAAMNRFAWMWRSYPFVAGEVCCQKTALGFVDSIWEIFGPLLQGVPSVIIPDELVMDPDGFLDLLAKHGVTRIVLVPSLLRLLLDQVGDLGVRVPRLTLWTVSGETFPIDLARRMRTAHPDAKLLNIYGSSEVAADVTCYEVGELDGLHAVPIGRPISNSRIYILDPSMNPVPYGVLGAIHAGGDCLARGYWQRPGLTGERFTANPFRADERIYATGDIGKYRRDGTIDYVGRADGQIKVRGMRVELGEIEVAIAAHPLVRQAAVLVHGGAPDAAQELVAYVVGTESGSAPSSIELRQFLRTRLPQYMVPARFMHMDRLPVLPSGKVDRRALAPPTANGAASDPGGTPPRNETEEKVVAIWREALGAERIGIEDNFFELGGHSLLAVQVIARIRRDFGLELPIRSLFEEPTIASLATAVDRARAAGQHTRMPPLQRRPRATDRPEEVMAALNSLPPDQVDALIESLLQQRRARADES